MLYDTATDEVWRELVGWQLNMDIMAAIGFWDRVELGVALPVALTQDGDDLSVIGGEAGSSVGTGIGDLRVIPKVRFFTASVFSMGVALPVSFPTANKDKILSRSFTTLNSVADLLSKNKWVKKVRVEGHTDAQGNEDYNLDLSQRRAASVLRYLTESGIDADRLTSEGFGETKPIGTNRTAKGRGKNRRVEFIIIDPALNE